MAMLVELLLPDLSIAVVQSLRRTGAIANIHLRQGVEMARFSERLC